MKNTARTTVREGKQSTHNTYVRIAAVEQKCLQALSEHRQWWSGGHIRRQTVPDVGTGDREGPRSECRQAVWRHNELVSLTNSISIPPSILVFCSVFYFLQFCLNVYSLHCLLLFMCLSCIVRFGFMTTRWNNYYYYYYYHYCSVYAPLRSVRTWPPQKRAGKIA